MENNKFTLISEEKSSLETVIKSIEDQTNSTPWAQQTNKFAADYARHLGDVYGDVWYRGLLPKELLEQILLPAHSHYIEGKHAVVFPLDTPLPKALEFYKNNNDEYAQKCWEAIEYLKGEILKNGFTTSIVLVVINGTLKHVDGLHRLLALYSLLEEGYEYKPIPTFICNSTK
jgi:hypothetical protein